MSTYDPTSTEGLAEHASERLQMNARGLFTSDLSVNEYLCVEKAGFEPVGLVVGSSIYHIGFQASNWKASQEMGVLTQAMYSARELAMTRMEEEAEQLGADGIVGVRLDIGRYPSDAEGLAMLNTPPADEKVRARWRGPYMDEAVPADPWGHPYQYSLGASGAQAFSLYSLGADGKRGGEGFDADIGYLPAP